VRWAITKDLISDEVLAAKNKVGFRGENGVWSNAAALGESDLTFTEEPMVGLNHEFRLLDDDDFVYYEGRSDELEFEPLDWAESYAGCTQIQYKNVDGIWENL
jgi:hypothetical protein